MVSLPGSIVSNTAHTLKALSRFLEDVVDAGGPIRSGRLHFPQCIHQSQFAPTSAAIFHEPFGAPLLKVTGGSLAPV